MSLKVTSPRLSHDRPASYDEQAKSYDQRVGLPEVICRKTVEAVLSIAQVEPGERIVELGAGTGQIGFGFGTTEAHYIGLDVSQEMLEIFRQRLNDLDVNARDRMTLLHTDADQPWPVDDDSACAIFSSRAVHLMDLNHVADEIFRIGRSTGAIVLLGKTKRQKDSVRDQVKEAMQERLGETGFKGRRGEQGQRQLIALCCERGAEPIEPVTIGKWTVASTPKESIEAWQNKSGLAGIDPPTEVKQEVLQDVLTWATERFGDVDRMIESEETYLLQGFRVN